MADSTLSILLQLKDDASGKLDAFQGKLNEMGLTMEKASKYALGMGAAITGTLGLMVAGAEEAREADARLATVIENTGQSYDALAESIDKTTSALLRKTGISDEAQKAALSQLIILTGSYESAMQMLPTVLDLAAAGQMDVSSAASMLGKAFEGNTSALKRYGIEVKEGATQAEILAAVQAKVAGAAERTANPFKIVKEEIGEINEKIGAALLPLLQAFVDRIVPIIERVGNWIDSHKALTAVIVTFIGAIGLVLTVLGTVGLVLPKVVLGFNLVRVAWQLLNLGFIASPIGLIITAIIALIAALGFAIYQIVKHWDAVKNAFKHVWDFIKQHWELLVGILLGPIAFAIALIVKHWDKVKEVFTKVVDWIKDKWDSLWNGAKQAFKDFCNFFVGMAEGFANVWVKAINWVIDCINKIHVNLPSWLGGGSFGFNISHIGEVKLPRLASGGDVVSGGLAVVGEQGAEVVALPTGSSVYPHGSGAGGGITWTGDIIVQGYVVTAQELLNFVRSGLLQKSRQNGGQISGALGLG